MPIERAEGYRRASDDERPDLKFFSQFSEEQQSDVLENFYLALEDLSNRIWHESQTCWTWALIISLLTNCVALSAKRSTAATHSLKFFFAELVLALLPLVTILFRHLPQYLRHLRWLLADLPLSLVSGLFVFSAFKSALNKSTVTSSAVLLALCLLISTLLLFGATEIYLQAAKKIAKNQFWLERYWGVRGSTHVD